MTLTQFIQSNRQELERAINNVTGRVPRTASCYCPKSGTDHQHESEPLTTKDLRDWILNDEGLYQWAKSEGMRNI